ncbi:MAG: beta-aspartyl-peptidase [Clostridia bacterium]|nr:beta-aspartyl-peptidase [Clostridia bacterium]
MIILKNGQVYGPDPLGKKDILIAGKEIVAIEDNIEIQLHDVQVIDCKGKIILPGFIDGHVHITGGGGEGSFKTRTPEIMLSDITSAGVTTVVGCLGTDGTTRNMSNLLAKAYALEEEGITTYVYTGSYQVPVKTLMSTIQEDIILVEKIIGAGEIALSDHRSSLPTLGEISKIASQARVGGMLSGKAGIVNLHLGDGDDMLHQLYALKRTSDIPLTQFWPTHMNRNPEIFKAGLEYAKSGGYVDYTTSTTKQFIEMGEVPSYKALRIALDEGVELSKITFTSDGQGSLPIFDENNQLIGLKVGKLESLYDAVREAVFHEDIPLTVAIQVITKNPARILKLKKKGEVKLGFDADLVIVDEHTLAIDSVIAMGNLMVHQEEILIKGTFEV